MAEMDKRIVFLSVLVFALALAGCAESEDPTNVEIEAHPQTWIDPDSGDFHGQYVRNVVEGVRAIVEEQGDQPGFDFAAVDRTGTEGCAACHGDLGLAEGDQCLSCHASGTPDPFGGNSNVPWIPHPAASVFLAPQNAGFHGRLVGELESSQECGVCHGLRYDGGWTEVQCQLCHAYADPDGNGLWSPHSSFPDAQSPWLNNPRTGVFHGTIAAIRGSDQCMQCHSSGLVGGPVRWASAGKEKAVCATCHATGEQFGHPAPEVWVAGGGHSAAAKATDPVGTACMSCHGNDLVSGWVDGRLNKCNDCHTWPFGG